MSSRSRIVQALPVIETHGRGIVVAIPRLQYHQQRRREDVRIAQLPIVNGDRIEAYAAEQSARNYAANALEMPTVLKALIRL